MAWQDAINIMPVWLQRILQGVTLTAALALGALWHFQEKLLYLPIIPGVSNEYTNVPSDYGLSFEDVWLKAEDGVMLHCWHISAPVMAVADGLNSQREPAPVVVFFQENAGNMSHRLHFIASLIKHLRCNVFVVGYHGYGQSQGNPNQRFLEMDAAAALAHVLTRNDVDHSRVVLYGKSLGGAVALHLAAKQESKLRAAIIENTFTSVEDMVPSVLPFLGLLIGPRKPFNFLVRNKWNNLKKIAQIQKLPLMLIGSTHDELVPFSHMQKLHATRDAALGAWLECPNSGHMDAYQKEEGVYWSAVRQFWRQHVLGPSS